MNRPTTDPAALSREEEGRRVFLELNYGHCGAISKGLGRGVALPLRWPFQAHRRRTFREKTLRIAFRFGYCHLSSREFGEVAVAADRL